MSKSMAINEENESYTAWLKSLKIGDYVAFDVQRYGDEKIYTVSKIKNITKTGKIKVTNDLIFNNYGECKIDKYHSLHLEKYTIEIHNQIKNRHILEKIQHTNFKLFSNEQLKAIYEIIK